MDNEHRSQLAGNIASGTNRALTQFAEGNVPRQQFNDFARTWIPGLITQVPVKDQNRVIEEFRKRVCQAMVRRATSPSCEERIEASRGNKFESTGDTDQDLDLLAERTIELSPFRIQFGG